MFITGLDLGQSHDPTAIAVVEARGTPQTVEIPHERYSVLMGQRAWTTRTETIEALPGSFAVRHLERLRLGTTYPDIVNTVVDLLQKLGAPCWVAVDATGVGRPVVDLLRQAGLPLVPIVITGGDAVGALDDGTLTVPKSDLVSLVAVALQTGRLKISAKLPFAEALAQELQTFEARISPAGRPTYGARSGAHDDLVVAVALACWAAELWLGRERTFAIEREGAGW